MGIIDFFLNLLSDPRGAIAGWIITLGAVWVYTPLFISLQRYFSGVLKVPNGVSSPVEVRKDFNGII